MVPEKLLDEPARPQTLCDRQHRSSMPLPRGTLQQVPEAEIDVDHNRGEVRKHLPGLLDSERLCSRALKVLGINFV
jgi:hypothetical protein